MTAPRPAGRSRPFALTVLIFSIGYASYFFCKVVFVLLAAPAVLLLTPFPNAKHRFLRALTRGFLTFFARGWLPALGLYRVVEVSGLERTLALPAAVVTANHRGFMDSLFMLSLIPRVGIVIKSRYARGPMYALLARHFDLISLEPGQLSSVASAVASCRALLAAGNRLLVYPEGTRARSGRLQNFNILAFDLARQAGLPVVPVVIHSTLPFMARVPGSLFPRGHNEYRIRFLDPEFPRGDDTAASLCDRVYRRMARELKTLDAGTVWENGHPARHENPTRV